MSIKSWVVWSCSLCGLKAEVATTQHRPSGWARASLHYDQGGATDSYEFCKTCLGTTGAAWALNRLKIAEYILGAAKKLKSTKKKK